MRISEVPFRLGTLTAPPSLSSTMVKSNQKFPPLRPWSPPTPHVRKGGLGCSNEQGVREGREGRGEEGGGGMKTGGEGREGDVQDIVKAWAQGLS